MSEPAHEPPMRLDVLSLALALAGAADPDTMPPGVHWEALAWDAAGGRLVLFGGGTGGGYLAGTWAWDGRAWRIVADSASGPSPRHAHAMAYDPVARRVMLHGGAFETSDARVPPAERAVARCDTWALEGARWRRLADGPCVTTRGAGTLVWDARGREMLLVDGPPAPPTDTALRPMRLWRWRRGAWELADSAGPRRSSAGGAAFDVRRGALVVPVLDGPDAGTWEWNGARWRRATAQGPSTRRAFALAYDAGAGQVVLFGGRTLDTRQPLADAWSWDGERWAPLDAVGDSSGAARGGAPGPRSHATLVHDARGRRLLLFGGAGPPGLLRELWAREGDAWRRVVPARPGS